MPPRRVPVIENQAENSVNHRRNSQRNAPPPPPPPGDPATRALEGMARLFEQQLQQQQLQLQLQQMQQQQLQQPPRPQQDIYEQFRRLGPKEFSGTTDPFAAEGWIRSLEVHFHYLDMGDADRVRCTTYLFRDEDSLWWEGAEHGVDLVTLTWAQFKTKFFEKYFTPDVRSRINREFMALRQGDVTVGEFVKKYDRGCHFVPLVAEDAEEKLRHFMDGLRPTIRDKVMMMRPENYSMAVTYADQAEQSLRDIDFELQGKRQQHQNNNQPNKKPYTGPPRPQGPPKPQGQVKKPAPPKPQNLRAPKPAERQPCKQCNRTHLDKCEWGSYKCFYCKEEGHIANDCPKRKEATTARAYVMNAEEAEEEADTTLITGKANVVTDALSRKAAVITHLSLQGPLQSEIQWFELTVYARGEAPSLATLSVQSTLRDKIRDGQSTDEQLQKWRARDEAKSRNLYSVVDGLVRYRDRLWVHSDDSLRHLIMKEAHNTPYSIHPGSTKMYRDL
ncbi:uncharacterized protein [Primulina eburnea]|uniref:uncharacterized protein n=1 Tax=Primulina eburnea TaxID=1245227 RepID=UPI003C6C9939